MYDFGILVLKLTAEWVEGYLTLLDASPSELQSQDRFIGTTCFKLLNL